MRHAWLGLLLVALLGCRSSPPPITDGMTMGWTTSVQGQGDGLFRVEFAEVDDGWRLTSQAGAVGDLKPPEERLLDEHLVREDGKPFAIFFFPVWLPPNKRSEGSSYEEMRVVETTSWKAWTAWHTTIGPANGYYDVDTGFLVGLSVPQLGGLNARLTETNVPGLAVAGS